MEPTSSELASFATIGNIFDWGGVSTVVRTCFLEVMGLESSAHIRVFSAMTEGEFAGAPQKLQRGLGRMPVPPTIAFLLAFRPRIHGCQIPRPRWALIRNMCQDLGNGFFKAIKCR